MVENVSLHNVWSEWRAAHRDGNRTLRDVLVAALANRLCKCGHTFDQHHTLPCNHEVGESCSIYQHAGPCGHIFKNHAKCKCTCFRDRLTAAETLQQRAKAFSKKE